MNIRIFFLFSSSAIIIKVLPQLCQSRVFVFVFAVVNDRFCSSFFFRQKFLFLSLSLLSRISSRIRHFSINLQLFFSKTTKKKLKNFTKKVEFYLEFYQSNSSNERIFNEQKTKSKSTCQYQSSSFKFDF